MEQTINSEVVEKLVEVKEEYALKGVNILGIIGAEAGGYDVFYNLSPEAFQKNPGHAFFKLFKNLKNDLTEKIGENIEIVDSDSLAPIGQDEVLKKIHYI